MPEYRLLAQLRKKLEDPATLVRIVGEEAVLPGIRENIDRGNFAPLKQSTLDKKHGFGPLRETDRLYDSLTPGSPDNVSIVTGKEGEFGTSVPYAAALDRGTANMPARHFMAVSEAMAEAAMETLARALFEK